MGSRSLRVGRLVGDGLGAVCAACFAAALLHLVSDVPRFLIYGAMLAAPAVILQLSASRAMKASVVLSAVLVNVFSMLNVGGFDRIAARLGSTARSTVAFQRYVLPTIAPGSGDLPYNYDTFDWELCLLLGVIVLFGVLLYRSSRVKMVVRPLQFVALTLLSVTIEVYLFDYTEFFSHVTQLQVRYGLLWFSNADLLDLSAVFLVLSVAVELLARRAPLRWGGRWGRRAS